MSVRKYKSFDELLNSMKKEAPTLYDNWNGRVEYDCCWIVGILHVDRKTWYKIMNEIKRIGGEYSRRPYGIKFYRA